ncbi:hypothetical protein O3P69_008624 [Scylla paramamosain]|uniref:Uncharacterized protein n=1 Tax=Scylla paramamosain TaxID=85552 RepID=A0AAW0SM19_SCYPA
MGVEGAAGVTGSREPCEVTPKCLRRQRQRGPVSVPADAGGIGRVGFARCWPRPSHWPSRRSDQPLCGGIVCPSQREDDLRGVTRAGQVIMVGINKVKATMTQLTPPSPFGF